MDSYDIMKDKELISDDDFSDSDVNAFDFDHDEFIESYNTLQEANLNDIDEFIADDLSTSDDDNEWESHINIDAKKVLEEQKNQLISIKKSNESIKKSNKKIMMIYLFKIKLKML